MMSEIEQEASPLPPLPKEHERRIVEDADARGLPVVLQGGEAWYIAPIPLSPRGLRLTEVMEEITRAEIDYNASDRIVGLATEALDTAKDEEAVEAARLRLRNATEGREKRATSLRELHVDLAHHALRSHYRVTREEAGALVARRVYLQVLAAVNGQDTQELETRAALALLQRVHEVTAGGGAGKPEDPFGRRSTSSSAGAAVC